MDYDDLAYCAFGHEGCLSTLDWTLTDGIDLDVFPVSLLVPCHSATTANSWATIASLLFFQVNIITFYNPIS